MIKEVGIENKRICMCLEIIVSLFIFQHCYRILK